MIKMRICRTGLKQEADQLFSDFRPPRQKAPDFPKKSGLDGIVAGVRNAQPAKICDLSQSPLDDQENGIIVHDGGPDSEARAHCRSPSSGSITQPRTRRTCE